MAEYIDRERIEKFFDGIYDCADLTFEPNDHCCDADDCGHCKWYEAKNAIQKRVLSIPAADVRPVVTCADCKYNNACLTQAFVEEESRAPFDRNTFFCADGERGSNA